MALMDYIWLIRLIMEILKLISEMAPEERAMVAQLRIDMPMTVARNPRKKANKSAGGDTESQPA